MQRNSVKSSRNVGVTLRVLIIGSLLIPLNCYWLIKTEVVWRSAHGTILSLFFNAVFSLFLLCLGNLLLHKFKKRFSFSQAELLVIYVMLTTSTTLFSFDMMQALIPTLSYGFWHATPENDWASLFLSFIPKWLSVSDKAALTGYYRGDSTLYDLQNIKVWITPVIAWSSFIFVLIFAFICINVIIRKQWIENEKLAYPVIQLPIEMTNEKQIFFQNRLMWIGFAIAGGLGVIHGIHFLRPEFPDIRVRYFLQRFFTEKPWSAIGGTPLCFYPFIIGLGYFMPLNLSFSAWFFYLFFKGQAVSRVIIGLKPHSGPHWTGQSVGAWIGITIVAFWTSRKHFWQVIRKTLNSKFPLDDSFEPISYRTATLGIVFSLLFIILFWHRAGMSIWVALLFFTIYFLLAVAITRIRAELGPPTHELYHIGPDQLIADTIGTSRLSKTDLVSFSLLFWLTQSTRAHPMPHELEALKIADRAGINSKKLILVIFLTTGIAIIVFFWLYLHVSYIHGWENMKAMKHLAWEPFYRLERWLNNPTHMDNYLVRQIGIGTILTTFLMVMRMRFIWWPFHPVGYAIAGNWTMGWTWFSIFISWLIKWLLLKYGGLLVYRRAMPFFGGLILGQLVIGSVWSITGAILDMPMYGFFI